MPVISKQEVANNEWWTWVIVEGNSCTIMITSHQVTEEEAVAFQTKWLTDHEYDTVPQAVISIYDYKEVVRSAIAYIKTENPSLPQWNAYLATLAWDDALMVRWFLAMLARALSNRQEIELSSYTETQVLSTLKTFIINAPPRRLSKIIFGEG